VCQSAGAVLPFENLSGGAEQDYFAAGIGERLHARGNPTYFPGFILVDSQGEFLHNYSALVMRTEGGEVLN